MISNEEYNKLLELQFDSKSNLSANKIISGTILKISDLQVTVDIGYKSEGQIPKEEFINTGHSDDLKTGQKVEVFIEKLEDREGNIKVSHEKAIKMKSWEKLQKIFDNKERVKGFIVGKAKAGLYVKIMGTNAFLPLSQIDVRPVRDVSHLIKTEETFEILKMDYSKGNIVVSRKAILEDKQKEIKKQILEKSKSDSVVSGKVKTFTDYGAFVDLGGIDGLVHLSDISWSRIGHPSDVLEIGKNYEFKILKVSDDSDKISLGYKQLKDDPWDNIETKINLDEIYDGKITHITDYGAFVQLSNKDLEGLVHSNDISWTKKNIHPNKILEVGFNIRVKILEIDQEKKRISLGIKQTEPNPWENILNEYKKDQIIETEVKNITEFGVFAKLNENIDGLIHKNDLSWTDSNGDRSLKKYQKGENIKVIILEIDPEKEKVSFGIKQLSPDPFHEYFKNKSKGDIVSATITKINNNGIEVEVDNFIETTIRRKELSKNKEEQNISRYNEGQKINAKISSIDLTNRKFALSIRQLEIDEEQSLLEKYGSKSSGSVLGDILGKALDEDKGSKEE
jgi:small subunit ribosomal protein S1